ncbi:aspartate dehydrogenase domain-containing protein [Oceanobacillus sp. CAU 1775]
MAKYKLALIGAGYLSEIIANAVNNGPLSDYELVGVLGRTPEKVEAFAEKHNCKAFTDIHELMALEPDYTAEASTPEGLTQYAETVLNGKSHLVVLSIGAFSDTSFYEKVERTAKENDKKVYIASGAVGGFDAMQTAALMSPIKAKMTSKKMPKALRNTRDFDESLLDITEPKEVFSGTTKSIMDFMPNGLNLAIATALASAGIEKTEMSVIATPDFVGDEYKIEVEGEEVWIELDIYSRTSAIAGWSVVRTLKNAASTIVL